MASTGSRRSGDRPRASSVVGEPRGSAAAGTGAPVGETGDGVGAGPSAPLAATPGVGAGPSAPLAGTPGVGGPGPGDSGLAIPTRVGAGSGSRAASSSGSKAARTRTTILEAALRMFRERGYDESTMRAIAAEAGVSVGNAYYYFASKEHLIQAFYDQAFVEHAAASRPLLDCETDLTARMVGTMEAWLEIMEPYRAFAEGFFKNAADPASPLSPFSAESAPARNASIELWREVVDGSDTKVSKALRKELPELLWLYFMGIVLYWVHDSSDRAARTRLLARRTAPMVVRAIGLARLPVLRATVADLVALVAELKSV